MTRHDYDPTVTNLDSAQATSPQERSSAVARLLEIAARNAEELLADAKADAEQLTAAAHEEADRLLTAARTEAQRVQADLEETRAQLNAEIARLQQVEHDHRGRLRQHLTDVLAQIEASPPA
jgi:cell division septum initiation protein DivIVA